MQEGLKEQARMHSSCLFERKYQVQKTNSCNKLFTSWRGTMRGSDWRMIHADALIVPSEKPSNLEEIQDLRKGLCREFWLAIRVGHRSDNWDHFGNLCRRWE